MHIPKTYESLTRYYGRYSCRRRGERAKLSLLYTKNKRATTSKNSQRAAGPRASAFVPAGTTAGQVKRIYEIGALECPNCKAQMRIIAFIQDGHSIKDIMKAQGIPDFQAPPPMPKFIDTRESLDELPSYDALEPAPDDSWNPLLL